MPYLESVKYREDLPEPDGFPFELPVVQSFESIQFTSPVTFFVGENGSGKSTLLEAIACALKCPAVGSADVSRDPSLIGPRLLSKHLRLARSRNPKLKLFFRAEDAIGFTRRVNEDMADLKEMEAEYERTLSGYARQLATGVVRGQHSAYTSRYGDNPDARSHGEWFINIIRERIRPKGLYLLDEPETPLSPIHQLTLLSVLKEAVDDDCQFIVATHSPILMALPGATILSFDHSPMQPLAWDEVEHVNITRSFLNDPESFLRHL